MVNPEHFIGTMIDGRYNLTRYIGQGSFGWVFEANQEIGGQYIARVAVKIMRPDGKEQRDQIIREIQGLAQLSHDHVLRYFNSGEIADGLLQGSLFLVTELGENTLEQMMRSPSGLHDEELRSMVLGVVSALAYLHGKEVVHRDVKPSNIFRVDNRWKLGDFGLARAVQGSLMSASGRKGTLAYMAPEIVVEGEVGPATDVYALGVTILECLTGHYAHEGTTEGQFIANLVSKPANIPPECGPWTDLIAKCLEWDPHQRCRAESVVALLQQNSLPAASTPNSSLEKQANKPSSARNLPWRHFRAVRRQDKQANKPSSARNLEFTSEELQEVAKQIAPEKQDGEDVLSQKEAKSSVARVDELQKKIERITAEKKPYEALIRQDSARAPSKQTISAQSKISSVSMFRVDPLHTGAFHTSDVPYLHRVKWKYNHGMYAVSSPAIANGVVYFGSKNGHIYAIDCKTGREIWHVKAPEEINALRKIDDLLNIRSWIAESMTHFISTPTVAGDMIYLGSYDGHLYALDSKTGQQHWGFRTNDVVNSSPIVTDGAVFFGGRDGYLYALDCKTSQEIWKYRTNNEVDSSPAIADGIVFFGNHGGYLFALDIKTGQEGWKYKAESFVISSPAVSDGTVYFGSCDHYLYALDIKTGRERWKYKTNDAVYSSPAVAGETVYFGCHGGYLYALDIKTGRERWKYELVNCSADSSPVIDDGLIYFHGSNGYLYAIE